MGKFTTLEKAELTKNWSLEQRSALAHFLQERKIPENESVFLSKSQEQALFFVESGIVRISYEGASIDLTEGQSFGEISILHSTQKLASALALKETRLWFLSHQKYLELRKAAPVVSLQLIESVTQKLANLLNRSTLPVKLLSHARLDHDAGVSAME